MDQLQNRRPIRRVEAGERPLPASSWAAGIPAVRQLLRDGLDLGPLTVLVGENGTGKSTLLEAVAMAFGFNAEGGTRNARHETRASESDLHSALRLVRTAGSTRWGFFLRAETMHGLYTYLERLGGSRDPAFHELSHGESFLALLRSRFDAPGLYLLDEPESALSFSACLGLVGLLHQLAESPTAQVVVATHSPVVAAVPGAQILELDGDGWHESAWEDLALVEHHRRFLADPRRYLRHVFSPE